MNRNLLILALMLLGFAMAARAEEAFVVTAVGRYADYHTGDIFTDVNIRMTVVYDSGQWVNTNSNNYYDGAFWYDSVISITVEVTGDKGPAIGRFDLALDDGAETHLSETSLVDYKDYDDEYVQWYLKSSSFYPHYNASYALVNLWDEDGGTIQDLMQYPDPLEWQNVPGQVYAVENDGVSYRNVTGVVTGITPLLYRNPGECMSTIASGTPPGPGKGAIVSEAAASICANR